MLFPIVPNNIFFTSDFQRKKPQNHNNRPKDLGERIIKSLAQMRANENKAGVAPMHEEQRTEPEPKPEPIQKPVSVQKPINVQSERPTKRESTPTSQVRAARFYSQTLGERIWLVFDYPGERLAYGEAQEILRLRNGSQWKIYPRSFTPSDGYSCYFGEEIPQLRGKSPEELRALHEKRRAVSDIAAA